MKAHLINSLGGDFYAERLRLGLRECDVAERAESSQSRISDLERALGNPSLDTIARVAAALGLEIELSLRPARERTLVQVADDAGRPRQTHTGARKPMPQPVFAKSR